MADATPQPATPPAASPIDDIRCLISDATAIIKDVTDLSAELKALDLAGALASLRDLMGKAREALTDIQGLVAVLKSLNP